MRKVYSDSLRNIFNQDILRSLLVFLTMLLALTIGIRLALGDNAFGIDFFIFWTTGKAVFIQHQNPYSDAIVQEIQLRRLNRLALPGENQLAFAYPFYMLFLVFPLSFLKYPLAQAIWLAFFILLLVTIVYRLFSTKAIWLVITAPFFYPFVFSIVLGNFDLLIGLILLAFFWAHYSNKLIHPNWQSVFGILLAFAIGKPQFSYLVFGFCFLVILKYRYWRTLIWFIGSLLLLLTASFLIYPAWFQGWISRMEIYIGYHTMSPLYQSIIDLIRGGQNQDGITPVIFVFFIFVFVISLINWWRSSIGTYPTTTNTKLLPIKVNPKELFVIGLGGLITFGFHPTRISYEQIILYVPLFLWAAVMLPTRPLSVHLFWWSCMALSWISFFLTRSGVYSQGLFILPIIFFTVWLVYLWFSTYTSIFKEKSHATP